MPNASDTFTALEEEKIRLLGSGRREDNFEPTNKKNNQPDFSKINNQPKDNGFNRQAVQEKLGATGVDLKTSIQKFWNSIKKFNYNREAMVAGACLLIVSAIWVLCCWSFVLTAKQLGMDIKANDPFTLVTKEPGYALMFGLLYILISGFEIHLFFPTVVEKFSGFLLVLTQIAWIVVAGIDTGGVWAIVNLAINNLNFPFFFGWIINFPDNDWWVYIIKVIVTLVLVFGIETMFILCWKWLMDTLNGSNKTASKRR